MCTSSLAVQTTNSLLPVTLVFYLYPSLIRPKSSERKIYDSKFTKVEDEKFKCVTCGHILSSIKANNFLSLAKEHYKRCHPDEIEAKSNEQAKQLKISDSFEVLPNADRNIQVAIAFAKLRFQLTFFDLTKPETFQMRLSKLVEFPITKRWKSQFIILPNLA